MEIEDYSQSRIIDSLDPYSILCNVSSNWGRGDATPLRSTHGNKICAQYYDSVNPTRTSYVVYRAASSFATLIVSNNTFANQSKNSRSIS